MIVDDLEWEWSQLGGVLPRLVDDMLERGGLETLVEAAREREDWFCAAGAARGLCAAGEFEQAWTLIEPFVATGWQPAVRTGVDVLLKANRVEQALELAHPGDRGPDDSAAWLDYAKALARAGRVDEAIDALVPYLRNMWVRRDLLKMTAGQGRDERLLELLAPLVEEYQRTPEQFFPHDLDLVLLDHAGVLERSGRVDEAIRLLTTDLAAHEYRQQNTVKFYAELLARHGRLDELRGLATGRGKPATTPLYVDALEKLNRAEEAETHLRRLITTEHPGCYESTLMWLLIRQSRFDEAIKTVEHTFDNLYDGNLLQSAMILLAEHGQHDRAIALTEGRNPEFLAENEAYWLRSHRWHLMGEAGRAREAIAEIEALPADEVDDRDLTIASLLAQEDRIEEAIALLRTLPGTRPATDLVQLLIRQGNFAQAVDAIPDATAQRKAV